MENLKDYYYALPKVELHRHLEGSLRLRTMVELARTQGITVPTNTGSLSNLVQVQKSEPSTYQNFLSKFATLRLFYRSPEVIARVTREAVEDAAKDNIRYLELRFTPVALSRAERFQLEDVMDWVCESTQKAALEFGLRAGLIVSVNRHESVELAEQVVGLAVDRRERGIVGLDLAGNEAEFAAQPFASIFLAAQASGLKLTIHAGEWGGPANVRDAFEIFNADRIGHGVRVVENNAVMALARERGAAFEVCVTSNYQTGAVPPTTKHPAIKMLEEGLNVTICSDDPSISQITLTDEYHRFCEDMDLSQSKLKERILAAARAAFLPDQERHKLVDELKLELM
ncbi:MAG TPA: adenosine deaminase [Anaerolineales bacterium]|nr:adenosine deaminase [Anaerolineales bacterium]